MRQLHARIAKLERATNGPIPADQRDPVLVSFMGRFGIHAEQCPNGVMAKDWLTGACKNAKIFGVVKSEEEGEEIERRLEMYAREAEAR